METAMAVNKKTAPHEPFHEKLSLDLLLSYAGFFKYFSLPRSYIHHSLPPAFTPPSAAARYQPGPPVDIRLFFFLSGIFYLS